MFNPISIVFKGDVGANPRLTRRVWQGVTGGGGDRAWCVRIIGAWWCVRSCVAMHCLYTYAAYATPSYYSVCTHTLPM